MYTSGSTGTPKGVLGTHKGLINRLLWQYRRFPYAVKALFDDGSDDGSDNGSDNSLSEGESVVSADDEDEGLEAKEETEENRDNGEEGREGEGLEACEKCLDVKDFIMTGELLNEEILQSNKCLENEIEIDKEREVCDSEKRGEKGEIVCRRTPLTFVDSIAEIFGALLAGVPLWAPPPLAVKQQGIAG
jgi:hypothetical protein